MKGYVLISVLMAMFFSTAVFSQDPDEGPRSPEEQMEREEMHLHRMQMELQEREAELDFQHKEPRPPQEDMERRMHLRNMQLEMQQREAEVDFQQEMKKLELEKRKIALKRARRAPHHPAHFKCCGKGKMLPFAILCFVVHILLAVWVYKDIRVRNAGSGIWIVIVLLTGLFGVLPYAIVRLGETRQTKS